jgi:hypothetical protein
MMTMIFTTEQTGDAFFGAEKRVLPQANRGLVIPVKPTSHHLPLFLEEFWFSFKSLVQVLV